MEMMDIYDRDRIPTGEIMARRNPLREEKLRLVVHICIFDHKGRLLIQQRAQEKRTWAGLWDVSVGGGVRAGETSWQAAEREVQEELGLTLDLHELRPAFTMNFTGGFDDFYLLERDVELDTLVLQEEEVADACWATEEEVMAMRKAGTFIAYRPSFLHLLFDFRGRRGALDE